MADAMQGLRELADVLNIETARISGDPQRLQLALGESESRKLQQASNLIDAEIDKLDAPESLKRLAKLLPAESKIKFAQVELGVGDKKDTPADIVKLEQVGILRSRLDPRSPNYDPLYTPEQFNQDISVLGVTSKALQKTRKQFIEDYMKEGRKAETFSGARVYSDEELKEKGEKAYDMLYGESEIPAPPPAVDDEGEDIIDLGTL